MAIGISTSCFYPLETEKAFACIGENGGKLTEVFLNAPSEVGEDFMHQLKSLQSKYALQVKSLHTYASFAESFFLFSAYERRFRESLEGFKRYFDAAHIVGAELIVMHGLKTPRRISDEEYFERFGTLCQLGKENGVMPMQENVVHYASESPEFLVRMRKAIGDDFKIVLDIKQARRAGYSPYDFIEPLGNAIGHVHISDFNDEKDCLTPLKGNFDFKKLFSTFKEQGYAGDYMIELYNDSYEKVEDIFKAQAKLTQLL